MEGLTGLLPIVIEICVPVVVVLIGWIIKKLAKKLEAEELVKREELIDKLVLTAVTYIEKITRTLEIKHAQTLASEDKLAKAVQHIRVELRKHNLPEIAGKLLEARVESALLRNNI
jgi:hypothetical protein